jgi:hypothetical protein
MRERSSRALRWHLLGPALLLLVQPVAAGQLDVRLEADAGARSDGNYVQRAPDDGTNRGGLVSRQQGFGRGGFNLDLAYAVRRFNLALTYNPFYEAGFENRDRAGVTHRLSLGASAALSQRSSLHLSERLLSSPTEELFGPTLPATVVVPREGRQLLQDFDAEIDSDLTRKTVLFIGADQFLRTFGDLALADSRGVGARAGLRFHLSPERDLEVKAGGSAYRFGPGRSADVALATVAYARTSARGDSARLELGGFTLSAQPGDNARAERSTGLQGVLDLGYQRGEHARLRWNASLRHGVAPGVGIARPVVLDNAVVGVTTVGRRVTVGVSASGARSRDFQELQGVDRPASAAGDRRLVDFAAGTLEASWSFSDWGRLHGGGSRIWQSSRAAAFDNVSYNRFFLGLAVAIFRTGERPENPGEQGELHVESHTP